MKERSSAAAVALPAAGEPRQQDFWDHLLVVAIFAAMGALAWVAIATPLLRPILDLAERQHWSALWVRPTVIWIAMGLFLMFARTVFWVRYRPFAPASTEDAPLLTVIIPAYNEGEMVEVAIASVATARYPEGRLEIIAVDDGSTDDTWRHMRHAALRYPGLVTTLRLEKNGGKRAALAAGFRAAKGEIVVTVDSDSEIERDTLLAIAGPFRDPRVGAVAGKGILSIVGLYSLYLLYLGLPALMKAPAEKATAYTVVVVIAGIVIWVIIGSVGMVFMPRPEFQMPGMR